MSLRGKSVTDPADQTWIDLVARYGHAVVKVADRVDEPTDEPAFAYSIGAYESYGAPELILFGLDGDPSADIINDFMEQYVAGRRFRCGVPELGLVRGDIPMILLETSPTVGLGYATFADWYYEREHFPLWQMFWPARNGCFPWDRTYPAGLVGRQPDLTSGTFLGHP